MARAAFQVLILPFRRIAGGLEFAVVARIDDGSWQGLAGGGEEGEMPLQAARREAHEEAGIPPSCAYLPLQTVTSIPVIHFRDRRPGPRTCW